MPDNGTIELAGALNGTLDLEGELGGTIQVPRDGVDGVSPVVTVTDITGGHRVTITDAEGTSTFDVIDGVDGEDGVSPTIEVSAVTGGHEIYITDASGVHLFTVMDGTNGSSATIQVTDITGGHRLTIRDASGTHTVDVMDGADGQDGADGADGAPGAQGPQGPAGPGVPTGGTTGQVLKKKSGTNYDTEWADEEGGTTEIFWATYGTTTSAELEAAYQAGKLCLVYRNDRTYALSYRGSATSHTFSCGMDFMYYGSDVGLDYGTVTCNSDSWNTGGSSFGWLQSKLTFDETPTASSTNPVTSGGVYSAIPSAATATPSDLGTAAVGSSSKYAKEDHVHKKPTASDIGAYAKPSGGIPATDLASAVQTSLGKADGAIAAPSSPTVGDFLVYTSNGWAAQSLSTWQGGSY